MKVLVEKYYMASWEIDVPDDTDQETKRKIAQETASELIPDEYDHYSDQFYLLGADGTSYDVEWFNT